MKRPIHLGRFGFLTECFSLLMPCSRQPQGTLSLPPRNHLGVACAGPATRNATHLRSLSFNQRTWLSHRDQSHWPSPLLSQVSQVMTYSRLRTPSARRRVTVALSQLVPT